MRAFAGNLRRLWQIVCVAAGLGMVAWRERRRAPAESVLPARVREAFERLGPTFVKLGQMLSVRPDVVPPAYLHEFERLQTHVPPFAYAQVQQTIASELGRPIEEVFSSFEAAPIAAASLAQVHRAQLPTGERLAVKVQRPGMREVLRRDIGLLRWLARLAERIVPVSRNYRLVELVEEFADWTLRELDFRAEGFSADHFRHDFRDDPAVYVPKVYWDLTTTRVLTMEFVEGAIIYDTEEMDRLGIDRQELARRGARTLLVQVFIHGFFHGDPHPGNFFALPGNRICYHDFGIVGYLAPELRRELASYFIAFARGDAEGAVDHLLHVMHPLDHPDLTRFRRDMVDLIGAWQYTGRQSLAQTFLRMLQIAAAYRLAAPSAMALLGKALITVEAIGLEMWPEFDLDEELRSLQSEMVQSWLSPERLGDAVLSGFLDYAHALVAAPRRFAQALQALLRGEIALRMDREELGALRRDLRRGGLVGALTVSFIVAGAIAFHAEGITRIWGISLGFLWLGAAAISGLWLAVTLLRH